jgi:hypothetical protein
MLSSRDYSNNPILYFKIYKKKHKKQLTPSSTPPASNKVSPLHTPSTPTSPHCDGTCKSELDRVHDAENNASGMGK